MIPYFLSLFYLKASKFTPKKTVNTNMTNNEVKPSESNKDKSEDQNKYSWEKPQNNIYRNQYKDSMQKFSVVSRLFFIWKGSVCKLIWHDMLLFIVLYALISIIYRFVVPYSDPNVEKTLICTHFLFPETFYSILSILVNYSK